MRRELLRSATLPVDDTQKRFKPITGLKTEIIYLCADPKLHGQVLLLWCELGHTLVAHLGERIDRGGHPLALPDQFESPIESLQLVLPIGAV